MDILNVVYQALKDDSFVSEQVQNRFKFYEFPETGDVSKPLVVLSEVSPEMPGDYADNKWLTDDYYVHVEVWVKGSRKSRDDIAKRIKHIMWDDLGFHMASSMPPEYDKDTDIFRDARRYRGKAYRDDFDSL